jgi:hypothetical protein
MLLVTTATCQTATRIKSQPLGDDALLKTNALHHTIHGLVHLFGSIHDGLEMACPILDFVREISRPSFPGLDACHQLSRRALRAIKSACEAASCDSRLDELDLKSESWE